MLQETEPKWDLGQVEKTELWVCGWKLGISCDGKNVMKLSPTVPWKCYLSKEVMISGSMVGKIRALASPSCFLTHKREVNPDGRGPGCRTRTRTRTRPWGAYNTFKKAPTLPLHNPKSWILCPGASVSTPPPPSPSPALLQAQRKQRKCSLSRRGLWLKLPRQADCESHHLKTFVAEKANFFSTPEWSITKHSP